MNRRQSTRRYTEAGIFAVISLLFTILITKIDVKAIGPENTKVGFSAINGAFHALTGYIKPLYQGTEVLGYLALLIAGCFVLLGLTQLIVKKDIRKVAPEILLLAIIYVVVFGLYIGFDQIALNYRPILLDASEGIEPSYPSSHTMLACTILGCGIVAIHRMLPKDKFGLLLERIFGAMMVCIVVGRLLSGVHWLTDILGAVLISATLVFLYLGMLATADERRLAKKEERR